MTLKQFFDLFARLPGGDVHFIPYLKGLLGVWVDMIPRSSDNKLDVAKQQYAKVLYGDVEHVKGLLDSLCYAGHITQDEWGQAMNYLRTLFYKMEAYALAK